MPHIIIEVSKNVTPHVDMGALLSEIHHVVDGYHNIALARVKTRLYVADHFMVGVHGSAAGFMHVNLKLMPGRDDGQKAELSALLQKTALAYLAKVSAPEVILTVEISELHAASYRA